MIAGILSVGTELLMGQTVNTNATFLSEQLNDLGISVYYHLTVGDNPERMKEGFNYLLDRCDFVFTTGGLGPTQDDITKEIVAEALGLEMVFDQHSMTCIEERFKLYNRVMVESNKRQAYFPEGAEILDNEEGTAPACIIHLESDKKVFILPGPPREMKYIFNTYMYGQLKELSQVNMYSNYLSVYDLGESHTEARLIDLIEAQSDPTIATYAGDGKVLVRVTSFDSDQEQAAQKVNLMVKKIEERIGDYIVSYQAEDINEALVKMMIDKQVSISLAESCTGGMIAESLVKISGSSQILERGIVTYSNEAKMDELGVKASTLSVYGAVSHETCLEMVKGLHDKTQTMISVSVTGIAGPTGGTKEKPVGLVYIGIGVNDDFYTIEKQFSGNRSMIRKRTMQAALKQVFDIVKEM